MFIYKIIIKEEKNFFAKGHKKFNNYKNKNKNLVLIFEQH